MTANRPAPASVTAPLDRPELYNQYIQNMFLMIIGKEFPDLL